MDIVDRLDAAGSLLADLSSRLASAKREARDAAVEAVAQGVSEREVARRIRVDRMTLRRWLGKAVT